MQVLYFVQGPCSLHLASCVLESTSTSIAHPVQMSFIPSLKIMAAFDWLKPRVLKKT
jgi:hypothetical protein